MRLFVALRDGATPELIGVYDCLLCAQAACERDMAAERRRTLYQGQEWRLFGSVSTIWPDPVYRAVTPPYTVREERYNTHGDGDA